MNDWKQEEFGLIQRVDDAWHFCGKGLYIILWNRIESFILLYDFLEISVMCHENPSRPVRYWAGRHDTPMTDLKNMTHLVTSTLQKQTTTKAKTLDTGLCLEKKCHESEKCHAFRHALFRGINSLQWLHRRSWWKQKKSQNRLANHLQKMLISLLIFQSTSLLKTL